MAKSKLMEATVGDGVARGVRIDFIPTIPSSDPYVSVSVSVPVPVTAFRIDDQCDEAEEGLESGSLPS